MAVPAPHLPLLAERLLDPRRFFAPGLALSLRHDPARRLPWELYHGRLLDPAHTRQSRAFASWGLHARPGPDEPLLALLLDAGAAVVHVVRAVEGYTWEGFDAGGAAFESRERRRWLRERIDSFDLGAFADAAALGRELDGAVARAVAGARLPLTPVEAPLPAFTFGRFAFGPHPSAPGSADEMLAHWLGPALAQGRGHRVVEAWLRASAAAPDPAAAAAAWLSLGRPAGELLALARRLFDDVSLSPWTGCVPLLLDVLDALAESGALPVAALVDFQASLLLLVGRHLTAYDLVTFHHRGANYPDALLLDELLRRHLARVELAPRLFEGGAGRRRRRALRQGCAVRRQLEGLPVPVTPTSPGERMRVYPEGHPRIDEEQILQPARRPVRLFAGDPLAGRLGPAARRALRQALDDLEHADERRELGAAVYLDRPLGGAGGPVAIDATPLLASLAFSRAVAGQRLRLLAELTGATRPDTLPPAGDALGVPGVPLEAIGAAPRPGTVTLADAARVSTDFVFLHTLPGSRRAFVALFDWTALGGDLLARLTAEPWLLARSPAGPGLVVRDPAGEAWLEIEPDLEGGYHSRDGLELPAAGLRVGRPGGPARVVAPLAPGTP